MELKDFKEAKELESLIYTTKQAIISCESILIKKEEVDVVHHDGMYYLNAEIYSIERHKIELNRNFGNKRLLAVMVTELKTQLAEFEKRFSEL